MAFSITPTPHAWCPSRQQKLSYEFEMDYYDSSKPYKTAKIQKM